MCRTNLPSVTLTLIVYFNHNRQSLSIIVSHFRRHALDSEVNDDVSHELAVGDSDVDHVLQS